MSLAFVVDGGLNDSPGSGMELYEAFPVVREGFEKAAEWTGVPRSRLLSWELGRSEEYRRVGAIRQAALALGASDALAERGIVPAVTAGMSRGTMIGAAIAGAVSRPELFGLLRHLRDAPAPSGPAEGIAQLFVPPQSEPEAFVGGFPESVSVAVEIGPVAGGTARLFLLAGYREALYAVSEQLRDKTAIRIPADVTSAFHSPLRAEVQRFQESHLAGMRFVDPDVPVCAGMSAGVLRTGERIRDVIRRNHTEPVSLPRMLTALDACDADRILLLGPGLAELWNGVAGRPVHHVDGPSGLTGAVEAIRLAASSATS